MNQKKYEQVLATLAKEKLVSSLKGMMREAEVAWKSQREAISLIDVNNDAVKGEKKLKELLAALDAWIIKLEILANGADKIAKRANKALHAGGRYFELEEDGAGYGPDESGIQTTESATPTTASDRRGSRRHYRRCRVVGHADASSSKVVYQRTRTNTKSGREISRGGI